jgi:uncharacterized protein YqeY
MTLRDRLTDEMKSAMKSRDELKLSAIRLIRSAVKNKEIEAKHELDDQGITEVISTLVKQRRESIRLFGEAGRDDLVQKEEAELQTLLAFLPQQMSRDEIVSLVNSVIAECGAQGPKDMGKVMKAIQPRVAGRADGKAVSDLVREALA